LYKKEGEKDLTKSFLTKKGNRVQSEMKRGEGILRKDRAVGAKISIRDSFVPLKVKIPKIRYSAGKKSWEGEEGLGNQGGVQIRENCLG